MAIRIQWGPDEPVAICDTVAEALEVLQRGSGPHRNNGKQQRTAPAQGNVAELFDEINDNAVRVLGIIANSPNGIEGQQLSDASGISLISMGGVFGGVSKLARKHNLTIERLIDSETRFEGGRRYRWFAPTDLLVQHRHLLTQ
jgi:hypothetical protein